MNSMSVMNEEGDTTISWDPTNPESVEVATSAFETYAGRGYRAYAMQSSTQGEIMDGFDPNVGSVLFVPQFQGG